MDFIQNVHVSHMYIYKPEIQINIINLFPLQTQVCWIGFFLVFAMEELKVSGSILSPITLTCPSEAAHLWECQMQ